MRAAAARLGFRLVDTAVAMQPDRTHACTDYLYDGEGTFLDLRGAIGRDQDAPHGFWSAGFTTRIELPGARAEIFSSGEADPAPRPPGALGFVTAALLRPLLHRLAPVRPLPIRTPEDLGAVLQRHAALVRARGGTIVRYEGDVLAQRFAG